MNKHLLAIFIASLPTIGLTCTFPDLQLNMLGKTSDAITCKYKLIGKKTSLTGSVCAYRLNDESKMFQHEKGSYSDGFYTVTKCKSQIGGTGIFMDKTCVGREKFDVQFKHIGQSIAISGKTTTGFFGNENQFKVIQDCKEIDIDVSLFKRYMNRISLLNKKPIIVRQIDKERKELRITHVPSLKESTLGYEELFKLRHLQIVNLHPIHGDNSLKVTDKVLNSLSNKKFTCFKLDLYDQNYVTSKKMGSLRLKGTEIKFSEGLEDRAYGSALTLAEGKLSIAYGRTVSQVRIMDDKNLEQGSVYIDLDHLRCFAE